MHCRTAALLAGLVLALAACSDFTRSPLAPEVTQAPLLATHLEKSSIQDQTQSTLPLAVNASCRPDSYICDAWASGGSGGFNFTWSTPAYKTYQMYDYSQAMVETPCSRAIQVTVTDSSGATASDYAYSTACTGPYVEEA